MLTSGQTSADIKVEPRSTFKFRLRVAFHLLSLFHLRTYILRAFTVEINPQRNSVKSLKIRNLQIFNCLKAKENIAPKSKKKLQYGCMVRGKFRHPTIQTSVKSRDFMDHYLCSL